MCDCWLLQTKSTLQLSAVHKRFTKKIGVARVGGRCTVDIKGERQQRMRLLVSDSVGGTAALSDGSMLVDNAPTRWTLMCRFVGSNIKEVPSQL